MVLCSSEFILSLLLPFSASLPGSLTRFSGGWRQKQHSAWWTCRMSLCALFFSKTTNHFLLFPTEQNCTGCTGINQPTNHCDGNGIILVDLNQSRLESEAWGFGWTKTEFVLLALAKKLWRDTSWEVNSRVCWRSTKGAVSQNCSSMVTDTLGCVICKGKTL